MKREESKRAENRVCFCGKVFVVNILRRDRRRIYCSRKCSNVKSVEKSRGINLYRNRLSTGTVGALAEILVSSDLMKKGYEVFRALSPSSSCDLLIAKDGGLKRVEVRTGHRKSNRLTYTKAKINADIIAVVIHEEDDKIEYLDRDGDNFEEV